MNLRKTLCIAFVMLSINNYSQNNQILFDFDGLAQNLLLNPGAEFKHDYFISVPFLSGISIQDGYSRSAGLNLLKNPTKSNFKTIVTDALYAYQNEDSSHFNEKIDIINAGYKLKNGDFLSFGFYQELDVAANFPKDVIPLTFYNTIVDFDRVYNLENVAFKAEMVGVLHVGISHAINDKFTLGGRFKIYSSAFNVQSNNNQGSYRISPATNTAFNYDIENLDLLVQSSGMQPYIDQKTKFEEEGLDLDEDTEINISDFTKDIYSFKNAGMGFDIGFTYKANEQFQITGSVLDIGYIKNKNDVRTNNTSGDYYLTGDSTGSNPDPLFNITHSINKYLDELDLVANDNAYFSYRPIKINLAAKYQFGEFHNGNDCASTGNYYDNPYANAIGFHLFSVNRPLQQEIAATVFYERGLGQHFKTRITYTVDPYSAYNVGLGISSHIGIFNMYIAADNLLQIADVATKPNNASIQFGINLLFDKKH